MEARTQGSRPRTQKKNPMPRPRTGMLEAKDQGHKCKCFFNKKGLKNFFRSISKKTVQKTIFQPINKILTIQKRVLSSSRGQGNFRGLEASRPKPRTSKCVLENSTSGKYCRQVSYSQWWASYFLKVTSY